MLICNHDSYASSDEQNSLAPQLSHDLKYRGQLRRISFLNCNICFLMYVGYALLPRKCVDRVTTKRNQTRPIHFY
jgi:hypothetical protein